MREKTLIDPVKQRLEPTSFTELNGFKVKAYLKNGALIKLNSFEQPGGNDNSQRGWSITGHKFVLHGRAILDGSLGSEKIVFE